jgi:hypothetical protein
MYAVGDTPLGLQFGQTAVETFSYTLQDSAGAQSTAAVTVNIIGAVSGAAGWGPCCNRLVYNKRVLTLPTRRP